MSDIVISSLQWHTTTNPGPTTSHTQVWICDICYTQIYVREQISVRRYRIEHWVHLRCVGINQEQYTYTYTYTCNLQRDSRLTSHTDITPPHPSRSWSKPNIHSPPISHTPPTPPQPKHRHTSKFPLFSHDW